MKKKYIFIIVAIAVAAFFGIRFFFSKVPEATAHYGVKANELRKKLQLPLIDEDMYEKTDYAGNGSRWNNKRKEPKGNEILHVWKNVIPKNDESGLFKEYDAYKRISNDTIYQLNIVAEVVGDTAVIRQGTLYRENSPGVATPIADLTDLQVDSLAKLWGLKELVRNK